MEIKKETSAGTLLSNDCYVTISPSDTLEIDLTSSVMDQFGEEIKKVALEQLEKMNVTKGKLVIDDKGALNYTIKARIETVVNRANE